MTQTAACSRFVGPGDALNGLPTGRREGRTRSLRFSVSGEFTLGVRRWRPFSASRYLRKPMMMNAMTSPYSAMASTNANPIHMYLPTRPSAPADARRPQSSFQNVSDAHACTGKPGGGEAYAQQCCGC